MLERGWKHSSHRFSSGMKILGVVFIWQEEVCWLLIEANTSDVATGSGCITLCAGFLPKMMQADCEW